MGRVRDRRLACQPCFQTLAQSRLGHLLHGLPAALLGPAEVRLQSRVFLEKMRQKAAESVHIIVEHGFCSLPTRHALGFCPSPSGALRFLALEGGGSATGAASLPCRSARRINRVSVSRSSRRSSIFTIRSNSRSIWLREGRFRARRAASVCGCIVLVRWSCHLSCCSKNLLCMVAKISVPITLAKPCEMVSSWSIHNFCEVWIVSGDSVKALVQNSVHMVTNCCQACDGSGGCGAVAA